MPERRGGLEGGLRPAARSLEPAFEARWRLRMRACWDSRDQLNSEPTPPCTRPRPARATELFGSIVAAR
ncbi:hypothetical protein CIW48_09455 [Methylobacterium sp. P1-11]|nr:hypothetical protein CIW48_09455 [Methylobacterium sp. P1-11]